MTTIVFPRNLWLTGVAVVLAVLAFVVPADRIQSRAVDPLLEAFDGQAVAGIRIFEGAELRVSMRRGASPTSGATVDAGGPAWTIDQLFGAPAFGLRVDSLISRIGAMTTLDLVGEGPDAGEEFALDDRSAVRLILDRSPAPDGAIGDVSAGDPVELTLAPATGGGAFVRRAGTEQVYRIARFPMPPTTPLSWFDDRSVAPLEELQVMEIRASGEALGEAVTIARPPRVFDGRFFDAEGRALSRESVVEVLTRLRSLFPVDVLSAADPERAGVEGETFRLDVTPSIGKPFQVHLAPIQPDAGQGTAPTQWRAHRSGNDFTVALRAEAVEGLIRSLRDAAASAE